MHKRFQIILTAAFSAALMGMAAYDALHPDPRDYQAMTDIYWHPIASLLGAISPALLLIPLIYWVSGRVARRVWP